MLLRSVAGRLLTTFVSLQFGPAAHKSNALQQLLTFPTIPECPRYIHPIASTNPVVDKIVQGAIDAESHDCMTSAERVIPGSMLRLSSKMLLQSIASNCEGHNGEEPWSKVSTTKPVSELTCNSKPRMYLIHLRSTSTFATCL